MGHDQKKSFVVRSNEVLQLGSKGATVITLQTKLQSAGFYRGEIDGSYGSKAIDAVKDFQKHTGLVANGIVGPDTWSAINGHNPSTSSAPFQFVTVHRLRPRLRAEPTPEWAAARVLKSHVDVHGGCQSGSPTRHAVAA